jgi:uncharacterized membrane protein YuzA (DUF378 family)
MSIKKKKTLIGFFSLLSVVKAFFSLGSCWHHLVYFVLLLTAITLLSAVLSSFTLLNRKGDKPSIYWYPIINAFF